MNRQPMQTIPPSRLRRATSLYTREALGGRGLCSDTSPRVRVANLLHWGRLGSMYDFPWKVDYRAAPN